MAPPPSPSLPPPSPSDDALRLPSLDALRAFEAAARLGSYERAAEALHITASAVGKRVVTLEEQLGLTLFQRGSKPLQLSASGREYLAAIWPALEQLARVPQHQRGAQRGQRLRLSAPPTLAREVLVPALPASTCSSTLPACRRCVAPDWVSTWSAAKVQSPTLRAARASASSLNSDCVHASGPGSDRHLRAALSMTNCAPSSPIATNCAPISCASP